MDYSFLVNKIADILKSFDSEKPRHKQFQEGVGPFGEPQLIKAIADKLNQCSIPAKTKRTPDLEISNEWAIEFKIVRPYGDNGKEAENWTVNLLHPYPGNESLIGDAIKLQAIEGYTHKGLFIIGYEHDPAIKGLDPIIRSFELISRNVMGINLGERVEERRSGLVHPVHRVVRCIGWELLENQNNDTHSII